MRDNTCQDFFFLERLSDIIDCSRLEPFDFIFCFGQSGHKNHGDVFGVFRGFQAATCLETIYPRHNHIQQDQVRMRKLSFFKPDFPIASHQNFKTMLFQILSKHP